MATNSMNEGRFTWGSVARVLPLAAFKSRAGATGSVCGIRRLEASSQALVVNYPAGTVFYLVEFGDGQTAEFAEAELEEG